ncbi:sensor histidine kinase [Devosia beringensis]|uniref:sensor histidine kinase n=1 Tax=Devosia beringensis TaxID=2657486 RepID=UPI00186B8214|nr:HAMP domain-containing sensor histidine kinase [Devosia beringensis]
MNAEWTTLPHAPRVLQHADDPRPAWLWSHDGLTLIWQNRAAGLFLAKLKKHGLKLAPPAVPIKGQVARNIRLGSPGRTSLARIQFLAGDKPTSSTCATTPLTWQDGQSALLIVGVDAITDEIMAAAAEAQAQRQDEDSGMLPRDAGMATAAPDDEAAVDAPMPDEPVADGGETPAPYENDAGLSDAAAWTAEDDHGSTEPEASRPDESEEAAADARDDSAYAQELDSWRAADQDGPPALSLVDTAPAAEAMPQAEDEAVAEAGAESNPASSRLSRLVDRMAADEALYAPLTEADDGLVASAPEQADAPGAPLADDTVPETTGSLFKVTGRGFIADDVVAEAQTDADADLADLSRLDAADDTAAPEEPDAAERLSAALAEIAPPPTTDPEIVERVSRYNFDELSRILNDRVGEGSQTPQPAMPTAQRGALINLGGETLVLNRLPLGILVFRDQQVLFANRAITEMVGYDSVEALRQAGLAAVFPAAGPEGQEAGPVNHLVQRDGTMVPVTARLQSISWHGRPALMLSASTTEVRTGHEGAVNAFAQALAEVRGDGFFEATRTGVISRLTPKAAALLGQTGLVDGKPLTGVIAGGEVAALRNFLDRPARFAETERPWLTLQSSSGRAEITLFAQGQAGVVTGYFGLVRGREAVPVRLAGPSDVDPALLGRISRGIRRPLNSIIGFADLIGASAGAADTAQLLAYARDISAAGQDIAALVDELEDYARLRDGRYLPQRASIDLTELLESCVLRIRQQASNARVFVRNAISESLPRLIADRASLEQAVLNLLASAIDQSPNGGAVVISAQPADNGGIAVHVRDNSVNAVDMAERFVVFRDGVDRDGKMRAPVRSSVGLALTRSLLAVNAFSLTVDPAGEQGMLFTLKIPADLVERDEATDIAE